VPSPFWLHHKIDPKKKKEKKKNCQTIKTIILLKSGIEVAFPFNLQTTTTTSTH